LRISTPQGLLRSLAEWQKRNFDTSSIIADPCFVDPPKDNHSLQPDSLSSNKASKQPTHATSGCEDACNATAENDSSGRPGDWQGY